MRVSVVLDSVDPGAIAGFWQAALGYRLAAEFGSFLVLVPVDRDASPGQPVLVLQRVPEEPAGKNRVHLDLHPLDPAEHVARLEALGAQRVGPPVTELLEAEGLWWQPMADPQGNVFCVVADPPPA